jgi:23S rRNA pseudouridine1911/1915/1917 synthase
MVSFAIAAAEVGQRLDQVVAARLGVPRAQTRRWIDEGRVRVDGRAGRPGQRVRAGECVEAAPPQPEPLRAVAEPTALCVLYEDADLIVVDKPAGMVVHPAPGHARGTLVNALLDHCTDLAGIGGVLRPGIVHRLDRGTSGVLVAAKHDAAHHGLARQFKDHSIGRVYRALVRGVPAAEGGEVERAIGRHPRDRKRMSVHTRAGRPAHTRWRVLRRFPVAGMAWLEIRPETGRTHQIRVHLASVGLPIAGDPVYGKGGARPRPGGPAVRLPDRPALHAAVLEFAHPRTGERLRFEAPLPEDLALALADLASLAPETRA